MRRLVGLSLGALALTAAMTSGVAAAGPSTGGSAAAQLAAATTPTIKSDVVWKSTFTSTTFHGHATMTATPAFSLTNLSVTVAGVKTGDTIHLAIRTKRLGTIATIRTVVDKVTTKTGTVTVKFSLSAASRAALEADLADGGSAWVRITDGTKSASAQFLLA